MEYNMETIRKFATAKELSHDLTPHYRPLYRAVWSRKLEQIKGDIMRHQKNRTKVVRTNYAIIQDLIGAFNMLKAGETLTPDEIQDCILDLEHLENKLDALSDENDELQGKIDNMPLPDELDCLYPTFSRLFIAARVNGSIIEDHELMYKALETAALWEREVYAFN